VAIAVTGGRESTLLAFLSSGCVTCQRFWDDFQRGKDLGLPRDIRLVVVTKGPDDESVSRLRALTPGRVPVVMSTHAWRDYGVPGAPYFVLVAAPDGVVAGEGSAGAWPEVRSFIGQALADARAASERGSPDRADTELMAAGIGPGHPSLYGANALADEPEASPTSSENP
jgi:hypothetical protein